MSKFLQYKGYFASVDFSVEDKVLYGKVEGINDLINFESESANQIENEFHEAVDDYLEYCKRKSKEPDKTYRGSFNVRISPEMHKALATKALRNGISLNQAVENAIQVYLDSVQELGSLVASIEDTSQRISKMSEQFENACVVNIDPRFDYYTSAVPKLWSSTKIMEKRGEER